MLTKRQLIVKRSRLPRSGKGLFTKVFIPKNTTIIEYKGKVGTWKELKNEPDNGYLFYVNKNHVIDALPTKDNWARYANDAKGLSRTEGIRNNCQYVTEGLKVYIKSMRDLQPGDEILVGYGKEYWDVRKENMR